MRSILNKRIKFLFSDQISFSKISGDFNPIHIDKEYARRSIASEIAVHGINILFTSINIYLKKIRTRSDIKSIRVKFLKFIHLNKFFNLKIYKNKKYTYFEVFDNEDLLLNIEIKFTKKLKKKNNFVSKKFPFKKPLETDLKKFKINNKFFEKIEINKYLFVKKYKYLNKFLNFNHVLDLITITRLIGMKVPGKNSILYEIILKNKRTNNSQNSFILKKFDKRFNLINLSFFGQSFRGEIITLLRPKKIIYSIDKKKLKIKSNEFSKQRALVIGGSKGLGETTVRILKCGSASILFSYNKGSQDAKKIRSENIKNIHAFNYNVEKKIKNEVKKKILKFKPTHLYYFATPKIFSGKNYEFDLNKLEKFNDYYLNGFLKIFNELDKKILKKIFLPSSIAVNKITKDLCEYSCSKASQEILLKFLEKKYKHIQFSYPRLPRLKTDQTLNVFDRSKMPDRVILKFVRKLL